MQGNCQNLRQNLTNGPFMKKLLLTSQQFQTAGFAAGFGNSPAKPAVSTDITFFQSRRFWRFYRRFCRRHLVAFHRQHKKRHLQFPRTLLTRLALWPTPAAFFVKTCGLENLLAILPCQAEAAKPATPATKPACVFCALTNKTCVYFVSISAVNWHASARHSKKIMHPWQNSR